MGLLGLGLVGGREGSPGVVFSWARVGPEELQQLVPKGRWPGHKIWMEFLREKEEEAIQAKMVLGGKERERGKVYGGSM
jgi:hypothetical protein